MEGNKCTTNEMLVTIDAAESDEAICCIVVPNTLLLDLSTKTWESLSLVACSGVVAISWLGGPQYVMRPTSLPSVYM